MPDFLVRSFAPLLNAFQPCFTRPSFDSFWALTCAWILCSGRRSLTRVIQAAQLTDFKHFASFHRFFSLSRWNLDALGYRVFQLLLPYCSQVLTAAVDDTLARKSGRHIWGAGMHHDPLLSSRQRPLFAFGHNFVVLSVQVAFPFAPNKVWAIPILVRMYRKLQTTRRAPGKGGKLERKQTGQATLKQYRTRPELASEMIQILASWIPLRTIRMLADSEYAGSQFPTTSIRNTRWLTAFAAWVPSPPRLKSRRFPRTSRSRRSYRHSPVRRLRFRGSSVTVRVRLAPRAFSLRILTFSGERAELVNRVFRAAGQ